MPTCTCRWPSCRSRGRQPDQRLRRRRRSPRDSTTACTVTATNNSSSSVAVVDRRPRRASKLCRSSRRHRCHASAAGKARRQRRSAAPAPGCPVDRSRCRPGRVPPAVRCSASRRTRSATRTSSTSTSRRSCTAASRTPIGVDSNGYLVVGGGTVGRQRLLHRAADPRPAPPNNLLAPFWTDLDGSAAPGIYVATLSDGVNTWLVVEWQVNVWGTTTPGTSRCGSGSTARRTSPSPTTRAQADPWPAVRLGAENSEGAGQAFTGFPAGEARVTSTAPTPGGSQSATRSRSRVTRGAPAS